MVYKPLNIIHYSVIEFDHEKSRRIGGVTGVNYLMMYPDSHLLKLTYRYINSLVLSQHEYCYQVL